MTIKVSMEALLPREAERGMYLGFYEVLHPTKELSDVEQTFSGG